MNPFATLAKSTRTLRLLETQKANPSQALGGIIIPDRGTHVQVIDTGKDANQLLLYGYKANVWAYICVKKLASIVSQVWWRVWERTGPGDDDWQPKPDDWRNKLLAYPMGRQLSSQEVFYHFSAWLAIKGNAFLKITPGGPNGIVELIPMTPKNMVPVPDRQKWCSGYNYVEDGVIKWNVAAEEIIHARMPDPSDPLWGYGMLEAAWRAIQADNAAAEWRKDLYENGGVPPAAIIDEELAPGRVMEDQAALSVAFRRNAKNRVPMLMGGKKTLMEFGFTPSDMAIPEDRGMTRDEITAAFGMHPAEFSNEAATFDNQDSARRYTFENGGGELIGLTREALNSRLLTEEEMESDSVYIDAYTAEIPYFRRQRESKLEKLGMAIRSGVTRNDGVRVLGLGLEELSDEEGGNTVFIESGLVTLKEAAEGMKSDAAASFGFPPSNQPNPFEPKPEEPAPNEDTPPAE